MKINKKLRDQLNTIVGRYSKWCEPSEIGNMWDELSQNGVFCPCWSAWERDSHEFTVNGECVENSLLVFSVYEGPEVRNEYNIYFS